MKLQDLLLGRLPLLRIKLPEMPARIEGSTTQGITYLAVRRPVDQRLERAG